MLGYGAISEAVWEQLAPVKAPDPWEPRANRARPDRDRSRHRLDHLREGPSPGSAGILPARVRRLEASRPRTASAQDGP
jgi:hypothetical protein